MKYRTIRSLALVVATAAVTMNSIAAETNKDAIFAKGCNEHKSYVLDPKRCPSISVEADSIDCSTGKPAFEKAQALQKKCIANIQVEVGAGVPDSAHADAKAKWTEANKKFKDKRAESKKDQAAVSTSNATPSKPCKVTDRNTGTELFSLEANKDWKCGIESRKKITTDYCMSEPTKIVRFHYQWGDSKKHIGYINCSKQRQPAKAKK